MECMIYITGHKKPDTDSICSAIAYAELKRIEGFNAIPARLGEINRETDFVLKHFKVKAPDKLETVRTQISDLKIDFVRPVSPDISLLSSWLRMKEDNLKVIPVVNENGRFMGIVSVSDITGKYMDTSNDKIFEFSRTPLANILEVLEAELIQGGQEGLQNARKVVVAAMSPEEMEPYIKPGDIVLVGNRKESQLKALELGAICLILTCGVHMDQEALALAKSRNCIVISTPKDTFTAARLINLSIPVASVMTTENIVSFNIRDFIDDIREEMLQTRYRSYPVLDDEGRVMGFISRFHLISQLRKKVILLDHNEKSQTVDGIEQAEIVEIIDHHRMGDIQTRNPIYVKSEPVGSTASLIGDLYFRKGVQPTREMAGIMCAAIISDTIMFKSPTCTDFDRKIAKRLAVIAQIDMRELSEEMFKAGSKLQGMKPHEVLYNDFKEFHLGRHIIGVGQVNVMSMDYIKDIRVEMEQLLEQEGNSGKYSLILLMVTDIIHEGSEIFFAGRNKSLLAKAFSLQLGDNDSVYLRGVVSRKKQLIPMLAEVIV